jgi:hypothetical protein
MGWAIQNIPSITEINYLFANYNIGRYFKFIITGEVIDVASDIAKAKPVDTNKEFILKFINVWPTNNEQTRMYFFKDESGISYRLSLRVYDDIFSAVLMTKSEFLMRLDEYCGHPKKDFCCRLIPLLNTSNRFRVGDIVSLRTIIKE